MHNRHYKNKQIGVNIMHIVQHPCSNICCIKMPPQTAFIITVSILINIINIMVTITSTVIVASVL